MEIDDAQLKELQNESIENRNRAAQFAYSANQSTFASNQDPNLIEWQLELDNILERIEHLLKGDVLKPDEEGNIIYVPAISDDLKPLNEYGVQFLMNFLSFYLNRNTILSNYDDTRINEILFDLGWELTDQIYLNFEKMGLDTPQKQKRYPVIVLSIVHTIESAYNRAYKGGERESLRTARSVIQSDPLGKMNQLPNMNLGKQKNVSLFRPSTWIRG